MTCSPYRKENLKQFIVFVRSAPKRPVIIHKIAGLCCYVFQHHLCSLTVVTVPLLSATFALCGKAEKCAAAPNTHERTRSTSATYIYVPLRALPLLIIVDILALSPSSVRFPLRRPAASSVPPCMRAPGPLPPLVLREARGCENAAATPPGLMPLPPCSPGAAVLARPAGWRCWVSTEH